MVNYAYVRTEKQDGDRQFWGYLHENGTLQVKLWYGDVKDYTEDCEDNPFTRIVVPPFWAKDQNAAATLMRTAIMPEETA